MVDAQVAERTYLPSEQEKDDFAAVYDFLAAHEKRHGTTPAPTYALVGAGRGERVEVPEEIHRVLIHVVEALRAGKAVTVAPRSTQLTTQQAADLLNVSRPTLVKLLEEGAIPFERVSSRRTVRLSDVLAYREARRAAQYAALAETMDDEDSEDPATVAAMLAAARAAGAARRRRARTS